jgi:hypothetical protein
MIPGKFCTYEGKRIFLGIPDVRDLLYGLWHSELTADDAVNGLVDRALDGLDIPSELQGDQKFRAWVFEQIRDISQEIVGLSVVQLH